MCSPLQTSLGRTISLSATASDSDNGPSPTDVCVVRFPRAPLRRDVPATTTYTWTVPGPVTLALAVSDGDCGDAGDHSGDVHGD